MHAPIKDRSTKFWDRVSGSGSKIKELSGTSLKLFQSLKPYLKPNQHVLDFGCGQGGISIEISKEVQFVKGIDTSAGMIAAAHSKAASQSNVEFMHYSLFSSGLKSGSFEIITAFNILQYIDDKEQVFSKINELLKPGGLFISSTPCIKGQKSLLRGAISLAHRLGLIPKMYFYAAGELESEMLKENFSIVESHDITDVPERFVVARKRT